jgi:hypothetical protein
MPRRREAERRSIDIGFDSHTTHLTHTTHSTYRGGMAANVFSMFSSTASVDLTPACK